MWGLVCSMYINLYSQLPEQVNPSPSVNGSLHVHVKFGLSNPSLVQSAFVSHGPDRQGSGTVKCMHQYKIRMA